LNREDVKLFRYGINTLSSEELVVDFSEVIGGRIQQVLVGVTDLLQAQT